MPPRAQNYPNIRGWFSQQMQFCVGGGHDVGFNSAEISAQKLGPACPRPTSLRGPHPSAWLHAAGGGRMQGSHPPWLHLSQEERYRKKEKNHKEENSSPRQNSLLSLFPRKYKLSAFRFCSIPELKPWIKMGSTWAQVGSMCCLGSRSPSYLEVEHAGTETCPQP